MTQPNTPVQRREQWATIIVDALHRHAEPFVDGYPNQLTQALQSARTDKDFEAFVQHCAQLARDRKQQQALRQARQSSVPNFNYIGQMEMSNAVGLENNEVQSDRTKLAQGINLADEEPDMTGKIRELQNIFPGIEVSVANTAILNCNGSLDDAANMLSQQRYAKDDDRLRGNGIKTMEHGEHFEQIDIDEVSPEELQKYVKKLLDEVVDSGIKLNTHNRTTDSTLIADRLHFFKITEMISVLKTRLQSQPLTKKAMKDIGSGMKAITSFTDLRSIPHYSKSTDWRKVFDARLELAAFREIGQKIPQFNHDKATGAKSKNGNPVMAPLQATYNQLIRGYFDSDEQFNDATSSQTKAIKEKLQRYNVHGHKLSKLVDAFGYGIIACLPDEFDGGGKDRFVRWSMGRALAMIEVVKLSLDAFLIQEFGKIVGGFLDDLLNGRKEIAECLAVVDKFVTEHNIEDADSSSE